MDPTPSSPPAGSRGRLSHATSAHLRQHAADPVDWWPWEEAAFEEARRRDVPIFLSIGYASCHWCAVMQRESFQDPAVAAFLNERFVAIKVDRDQRPDVDALYISALLRIQDQAGWPASLFLGADLRPFTGATYLPPTPRYGLPSFSEVLQRVDHLWRNDRTAVQGAADLLRKDLMVPAGTEAPPTDASRTALVQLIGLHDALNGGFGDSQRFPQPNENLFLLHAAARGHEPARRAIRRTLDAMSDGALFDPIGGGFHRYCADPTWSRPRFEKLLADNAQLLLLYARAARYFHASPQAARDTEVARQTAEFLLHELAHPDGGFIAGLSASQDGVEGAYYLWSPEAARAALGPGPLPWGLDAYPIPMHRAGPATEAQRARLAKARSLRPAPARDLQRVVAHQGLTLSALAEAGRLLQEPGWVDAGVQLAERVLAARRADGLLPRTLEEDRPGTLDDHAAMADGLIRLYQARPNARWLQAARSLAQVAIDRFRAPDGAFVQSLAPELPVRLRPFVDESEPSGNGLMARVLSDLAAYGALPAELLESLFAAAGPTLAELPAATPTLHTIHQAQTQRLGTQLVLAGTPQDPTLRAMRALWDSSWRPHGLLAVADPALEGWSLLDGKDRDGEVVAWLCRDGSCGPPLRDLDALKRALG